MNMENEKCIIVIDENLSLGVIANIAAILGVTIGMKRPEIVGRDVIDSQGNKHTGIIQFPIPILKGNKNIIRELHTKLLSEEYDDLIVVDFTDLAQGCKNYDEYIEKMLICSQKDLSYMGIAICGYKKKINKLTGSMPLLR